MGGFGLIPRMSDAGKRIRPDLITAYAPIKTATDELPPDYMALLSLLFSIVGLTMKIKFCTWASVLACISSVGKLKSSEADTKQIMCTVTFALMGVTMLYMSPQRNGL